MKRECECYNQKGSFHVREMVDATIADRDKGHETG